jgi:uncharacterized protein (TIGR01777 family)
LTLLSRSASSGLSGPNVKIVAWDPTTPGAWEAAINGSDGIINLAGEPIAKRWTERQKEMIGSSRVQSTRTLVEAIGRAKEKPKWLLNASAIGYYGPHGSEPLSEEAGPGSDFLSRVCVAWEREAEKAESHGLRVVRLRTGIVLGKGGGALAKMILPFKLFMGGPLGSGEQWISWIHLEDEIALILFLMEHPEAAGAVNATAPNPVTMSQFCKAIGEVLNRPSWAPVPAFALRLMLGEMADMLLTGQRVLPAAAQKLGYSFKYPNLLEALRSLNL